MKNNFPMLKIGSTPSYLSPSALNTALTAPCTFFAQRLAPPDMKLPRDDQGLAAAAGTGFDIYVKAFLMMQLWPDIKEAMMPKLRKSMEGLDDDKVHLADQAREGMQVGKALLDDYKRVITLEEFVSIEKTKRFKMQGVPLIGILDAVSHDDETGFNIPFDWKISGYTSKSGVSPKPGYFYHCRGNERKGAHGNYRKDISWEEIDIKWARQLCTYGWGLGIPFGTPFPARIDMGSYRAGRVAWTKYRAWITKEFQQQVLDEYKSLWDDIINGTFVQNRIPDVTSYAVLGCMQLSETWF